MHPHRL